MSANAVAERVRRMQANKTIRGITAHVNLGAIGNLVEAQIDVKLRENVTVDAFEEALHGLEHVQSACLMTGSCDYAVRVACRDPEDLVQAIEYLRNKAGARETCSRMIQRHLRF